MTTAVEEKKRPRTREEASRMMTESGSLHFYFNGRDIMRLVRDLMMEGNWAKAFRMLMEGFNGMTYECALGLLNGEEDLDGWSDLEGPESLHNVRVSRKSKQYIEYRAQLAYMYGDIAELRGGQWHRPYGYVSGYGEEDLSGPDPSKG